MVRSMVSRTHCGYPNLMSDLEEMEIDDDRDLEDDIETQMLRGLVVRNMLRARDSLLLRQALLESALSICNSESIGDLEAMVELRKLPRNVIAFSH